MEPTGLQMILMAYADTGNVPKTVEKTGHTHGTVIAYLRREHRIPPRQNRFLVDEVVALLEMGWKQHEISGISGVCQSEVSRIKIEEGMDLKSRILGTREYGEPIQDRYDFIDALGLDENNVNKLKGMTSGKLVSTQIMRQSHDFFRELGADTRKVFNEYPGLLYCSRKHNLDPKNDFFDEIGISKKKRARIPELFTYSLKSMEDMFKHYVREFSDAKKAKKMFRVSTTLFGYKIKTIDKKIDTYNREGINFHMNYKMLEKNPQKVVDTRDFLKARGISEDADQYRLLIVIDVDTLKDKILFCEDNDIDWEAKPSILSKGVGTEENPGTLRRRVGLIDNAFFDRDIHPKLDYRADPQVLFRKDKTLNNQIKKYSPVPGYDTAKLLNPGFFSVSK